MAEIEFDDVVKRYPDGFEAVKHLNLEITNGELLVLVGPSGCGKSTALRMIAGLEEITDGELRIGGDVVNALPPGERDIAMVFQNYALYPHMSVRQNMGFALKLRGTPKDEIARKVEEAARILDLEALLDRKPRALSGGQRQRVAMGRAIVRHPQAFLMDEPLSNLDAKLRVQTRAEIAKLQHDLGVTTIYVTHDQVEALTMGDRVAVMRKGQLQQVDSPQVLYDRPLNLFVAGFIGSPGMNMLEAKLERSGDGYDVRVGSQTLALDAEAVTSHPALNDYIGRDIILGIRPEDLEDATLATDASPDRRLKGKVVLTEALGSEVMVHFAVDASHAITDDVHELQADIGEDRAPGSAIGAPEGSAVLVGRFSPRSRVTDGDEIEVAVDTRTLHFFDPETALGIYDNPS